MCRPLPSICGGLPLIVSSEALERTEFPACKHVQRPSQSDAYHRRIQKKWLKRWGYVYKPCAFKTPTALIVHPTLYERMKREGVVA